MCPLPVPKTAPSCKKFTECTFSPCFYQCPRAVHSCHVTQNLTASLSFFPTISYNTETDHSHGKCHALKAQALTKPPPLKP